MAQTSLRFQAVAKGGPCEVATVPRPEIEDEHDVLVEMRALAMQPLDHKMVDLGIRVEKWPVGIGMNGAGVVKEVGKGVSRFKVGDAVLGTFIPGVDRSSAHQAFAVMPEAHFARKPVDMSFEAASTIPIAYVTALAAVRALDIPIPFLPTPPNPQTPASVLVLGGSSSVGAAALQLLRAFLPSGTTILTTCGSRHHERARALGADAAFERDAPLTEICAAVSGGRIVCVLGAVEGAVDRPEILKVLGGGGIFAEVVSGRDTQEVPEGVRLVRASGVDVWALEGCMAGLEGLLADEKFVLPVPFKVVGKGLEEVGRALDVMRAGVSGEKVVVTL